MDEPPKKHNKINAGSFGANNFPPKTGKRLSLEYEKNVTKLEGLQLSAAETIKALQKKVSFPVLF